MADEDSEDPVDEDSVDDYGEDFTGDAPEETMEEGYEESNEENVEVAKEMEEHVITEEPKIEKQENLGEKKSFTETLLKGLDESIKRAYQRAQTHEAEKQREIASFIKSNEQYTVLLKDLWTKTGNVSMIGYIAKIELFSHCMGILFQQTEDYTIKKSLKENPFTDLLKLGKDMEEELLRIKGDFEKAYYDEWTSTTERREARNNFIDAYNKYLPTMNFFIQETLKGTIILTEKWKGREQVTGKPTGY